MSAEPLPRAAFTPEEVAESLGFKKSAVYYAIQKGRIKVIRLTDNGDMRIPKSELDRLMKGEMQ